MPADLTTLSADELLARYARCVGRDAVAFCPQADTAALRAEVLRRLREWESPRRALDSSPDAGGA